MDLSNAMVGGGFLEVVMGGLADFINAISDSEVAVGLLQVAIVTLLAVSGTALLGFLGSGLVSGVSSVVGAVQNLIGVLTGVGGAGVAAGAGETAAAVGAAELGGAAGGAAGGVGALQGALSGILAPLGAFIALLGMSIYGAKSTISELTGAGDALKGTFGSYEEASAKVQQLTEDQAKYRAVLADTKSTDAEIEEATKNLIRTNSELAVATEEMNRLQSEGVPATEGLTNSEEEAAQQASTLASHVNNAARALDAYKQSLSGLPDYSSALQENVNIAKDLGKQYREGTLNYNEAMSALEFFGIDKSSINTAKEFQEALDSVFNGQGYKILTSYDPYKTMATSMKELADHGEDVGATFDWINGELMTDVTDWEKLSKATGLTREQLEALIAPLQETSSGFIAMTADAEEALNRIDGIDTSNGVVQFNSLGEALDKMLESNEDLDAIQAEAYIDKLVEAGKVSIDGLQEYIDSEGKIDWSKLFEDPEENAEKPEVEVKGKVTEVSDPEDIPEEEGERLVRDVTLRANQIEVEETFGTLDTPEVEVTGKVTDIDDSEIGGDEFGGTEEAPKVEIDIEANTESLEEVWGALDEVESSAEDIEVSVETDTDGVEEAAEEVDSLNEMEVTEKTLSVDYSDATAGLATWQAILNSPAETHKYEYIHVITIYSSVGGRAKGVKSSPGETALVNDGTPINGSQAELIVQNGRAYIAHGGETGVVNLKRGATVYTAAETQSILRQKGLKEEDLYGEGIPSFADGTSNKKPISGLSETNFYGTYGETIDYTSALFRLMGYSEEDIAGEHRWSSKYAQKNIKKVADGIIKELKHYRAMDIIDEEEYYRTLYVINEAYYKDHADLQDEYWKYQEEIYKHQSDSLDDIIEKEEKLNELAKAKTQKVLVYRNGMYQYIQNIEAISKAQRDVYGYASGTTSASGGLSLVGENGPELRVLGQGDGIIPTDITKNLMRIGSTPLGSLGVSAGDIYNFDIGTVKLENVNNVNDIFEGLKNLAIQKTAMKT